MLGALISRTRWSVSLYLLMAIFMLINAVAVVYRWYLGEPANWYIWLLAFVGAFLTSIEFFRDALKAAESKSPGAGSEAL